jgi:hypothetical protein
MHDKLTLRRRHFHANGVALVGDTTCCGRFHLGCRAQCLSAWRRQADKLAVGGSLQGLAPFVDQIGASARAGSRRLRMIQRAGDTRQGYAPLTRAIVVDGS